MEVFTYGVRVGSSGQTSFRTLRADFGDGYTQEAADGINTRSAQWSISVKGRMSGDVGSVMSFIDRHGGYQAFQWSPPGGVAGLFKCREGYQLTHIGRDIYDLSATFEEVHYP